MHLDRDQRRQQRVKLGRLALAFLFAKFNKLRISGAASRACWETLPTINLRDGLMWNYLDCGTLGQRGTRS